MNEFAIIDHYFKQQSVKRADVILGIGDDGAILTMPANQDLVISVDTLVADVHFFSNNSPFDIGYKALAVNLSDLAAMGANPAWFTLALTLPSFDDSWLKEFSRGLFSIAEPWQIELIGGDTTRGPLSITIQVHGLTPKDKALRRNGAKPGDGIYITHTLGDAAAALNLIQHHQSVPDALMLKLNRPEPRVKIGQSLRGIATAAIDISDGLAADVGHILKQSQVGAIIYVDEIPLSKTLLKTVSHEEAIHYALNGGDDYELCFTAPKNTNIPEATCIGYITDSMELNLLYRDGKKYNGMIHGYQHF